MRILLLDIETSPNTAHVWGLWDQNVSINQLLESSYILCWAAKWLGDDTIMWSRGRGKHGEQRKAMLRTIHSLLGEADTVVHYNGSKFDLPTLNKEFLLHNIPQPAPYKQIDLLKVARTQFKFTSNKLNYVTHTLGLGEKTKHHGHELWIGCMNGDEACWKKMEQYNKQDVVLLEKLYHRFLPWIKTHTNQSLHGDNWAVCPICGSKEYQRRGYAYTQAGKYARFQCKSCHGWFRAHIGEKLEGKFLVT